MRNILILGAGRSATVLISQLLHESFEQNWFVHVGDLNHTAAERKVGPHPRGAAYGIDPTDINQLNTLIVQADAVVSMLPPPLHYTVAERCLHHKKHFFNASYLTPELKALHADAEAAGLSFLCEMGLDPGIDHMSAMEMIEDIRGKGGQITSFRSHCGGLVAPESDDNPWHYKISWNSRNIVLAGKDGATYLQDANKVHVGYPNLFDPDRLVHVPGMGDYAWYPNRDSIAYLGLYGLEGVTDFVRTTLRHPHFCHGWRKVVELGLTSEALQRVDYDSTIRDFFSPLGDESATWDEVLRRQFEFLELDSEEKIRKDEISPADLLQRILEKKLSLGPTDKDMIIMLHELGYRLEGKERMTRATLVVKGDDSLHTAMAKTVGLPLALAVKNVLNGRITRRGVFIPVYRDVYSVVLRDLEKEGISFSITEGSSPSA
jgi:saccharopine dehydrogenase (NADP+, L-glutamate forming)